MPELRELDDRPPVVASGTTPAGITDQIVEIVLRQPHTRLWLVVFAFAGMLMMALGAAIAYLIFRGVGVWGVNIPVAWGIAIASSCGGSESATRAR
jgi:hypothetical protein